MTEWEKKIKQEICDDYCTEEELLCKLRKKEKKCDYNKSIKELIKREMKAILDTYIERIEPHVTCNETGDIKELKHRIEQLEEHRRKSYVTQNQAFNETWDIEPK